MAKDDNLLFVDANSKIESLTPEVNADWFKPESWAEEKGKTDAPPNIDDPA